MSYLKYLCCVLGLVLFVSGCAGKPIKIESDPSGAQVYTHCDFASNLLGTTPLTSSLDMIMPDWDNDGSVSKATLLFKKSGYADLKLPVSEFSLPETINVTMTPIK